MKVIKIMHVIGSMDLGGAEKLTKLTIEGLRQQGFESSVCCLKEGGYYARELVRQGIPVHNLLAIGKQDKPGPWAMFRAAWLLWRLLRREKPDVVHSHLFLTSILTRIVAWLAGRRCHIATLHRMEYPRFQPLLERLTGRLVERYVTDSRAAAGLLARDLGIEPGKIEYIHNGISLEEFANAPSAVVARESLGLAPDLFVIGVIAHLSREKGHAFLLEALAMGSEALGDFRLLVVGDGYLRAELEREARTLLPEGRVQFLGQRSDLPTLLSACDILVLPSRWEGFGIILAEAMYMRVPVITTSDGGGTAEVVAENEGGLLVAHGDAPALRAALLRLRGDREWRRTLGERGRSRVEQKFQSAIMVGKYAGMYRRLPRVGSC